MSDRIDRVSPTALSRYLCCPRQYEYDYVLDVETPERTERYRQQGLALHRTIELTCDDVDRDTDPETIASTAASHFEAAWAAEVDPDEFESTAHHEYFRRQARAGIADFFDPADGTGIEHARQSVATEIRLEPVHNDVPLVGYADNVLRTDDGLHVVDYKRKIGGMLTTRSTDCLADHLDGEDHDATRVKNAIQTAVYVEGVKATRYYEPGMDVRFSFYGLLENESVDASVDDYAISMRGYGREMTGIYADHYDTIWALITRAYEGITREAFEPAPWSLIREAACGDCDYRAMCPDYLAEEVRL